VLSDQVEPAWALNKHVWGAGLELLGKNFFLQGKVLLLHLRDYFFLYSFRLRNKFQQKLEIQQKNFLLGGYISKISNNSKKSDAPDYRDRKYLTLAAIHDPDLSLGLSRGAALTFQLCEHFQALDAFPKDTVFAIEPVACNEGQKELCAIGVWASVGHTQLSGFGMLDRKILIGESAAINGFTFLAVVSSEVPALGHELRDHSVKFGALKMHWQASGGPIAFFTSAERSEIFTSLRANVTVKFKLKVESFFAVNRHVHPTPWSVSHFFWIF
jgi:hypothetical protein